MTAKAMVDAEEYIKNKWPWLLAVNWFHSKIEFPTLIVIFIGGVWTGYIPSPLLDMANSMEKHLEQSQEIIRVLKENQTLMIDSQKILLGREIDRRAELDHLVEG